MPLLDGAPAVFSFPYDHPIVLLLEHGSKVGADYRAIVDQENAYHITPFLTAGERAADGSKLPRERVRGHTAVTR